jgi:stage II sporulation protein D
MIMLRKCLLMCVLACMCGTAVEARPWDFVTDLFKSEETMEPQKIKVLIASDREGVLVEVKGAYKVSDPKSGNNIGAGALGKRYMIQPRFGGLKWGEEFPGTFQISIVPDDATTTTLVDGIEYRGALSIYQVGDDKLSVINAVDIEDYLKSRLATIVDKKYSPEALAALVIAERTNAYFLAKKNKGAVWNVRANDVKYNGFAVTLDNEEVEKAVLMTSHLVMSYEAELFPASWMVHSGGKVAPYSLVFRRDVPGPRSVIEAPFAALDRGATKWNCTVTRDNLARIAKLDKITHLDVYKDKESGKVYALVCYDGEQKSVVGFEQLQNGIGADILRSSDFSVAMQSLEVVFQGYGLGHGVGLCLYSAEKMAERGNTADEILSTFFPQTSVMMGPSLLKKIELHSNIVPDNVAVN